jgi:HlyD family type I secretion membrane fusion protein
MLRQLNPSLLPQVQSDELLPRIDPLVTFGGLFVVGTVFTAINLATVIKYDVTVRANATVRPSGDLRLVQAAEAGTIKNILVKPNQIVRKGDVIAIIDDSQLQTRKQQFQGLTQQIKKEQSNLSVQIEQLDSQIAYEKLSIEQAVAIAKDDYNRIVRDFRNEQIAIISNVEEAQAELIYAQEALKRYQLLAETGVITELQIAERKQAFYTAKAKLTRAMAEMNPTNATIAIAKGKIAQEQEKGKANIIALKKQRQEIIRTQFELQKQIGTNAKEIQQIDTQLQKMTIRSPVSGTILSLHLRNLGQVVKIGDEIAQIAPNNAPMIVKARVNNEDIGKVNVCKAKSTANCQEGKVQMRIGAYPYPNYGVLKGSVKAISADTILPKNVAENNYLVSNTKSSPAYEVIIEPEKFALERNGRSYPIQPGMEVTADIISRQETVLDFLLRKTKLLADV